MVEVPGLGGTLFWQVVSGPCLRVGLKTDPTSSVQTAKFKRCAPGKSSNASLHILQKNGDPILPVQVSSLAVGAGLAPV